MTCQDLKRDLVAYVDGGLNDVRMESVKTHLASCAPCRAEVRAIQSILEVASAYRVQPLSKGAGVRMLAGVRERLEGQRRRRVYRLVPAFGVAALALAFAVVGVRDWRAPGTPAQESGISLPADARAASVTEDPELFEAVMDRLVQVEMGDPVPHAQKGEGLETSLRARSSGASPSKTSGPASLWQEYQQHHLQGERMESLLKDLNDEEVEQVLQKVEEKLSV